MKHCLTLFLAAALLFAACDKVSNPYPVQFAAEGICTTDKPLLVTEARKRILLEEYTGHLCGNCPGAAVVAKNIHDQYPNDVIVMSVHAGGFAEVFEGGSQYFTEFKCDAGIEWDTKYKISERGNPNGLVNRVGTPATDKMKGRGEWQAEVDAMVGEMAIMEVNVVGTIAENDSICGQIFIQGLDENLADGSYAFNLVLLEDSIVDWQRNYAPPQGDPAYNHPPEQSDHVENYVHGHVLRQAFNGANGTDFSFEGVASDSLITFGFKIPLDSTWRQNKLSVVGFVVDKATDEIVQVNEAHVE